MMVIQSHILVICDQVIIFIIAKMIQVTTSNKVVACYTRMINGFLKGKIVINQ